MSRPEKNLKITLGFLTAVFLIIIGAMFLNSQYRILTGTTFILSWITFATLGIALIVQTKKSKIKGRLRTFLLITGWAPIVFTGSIFLHNMLYALGTVTEHLKVIHFIVQALEVTFFLVSVPVAPIGFLVGLIGSIVLISRPPTKDL